MDLAQTLGDCRLLMCSSCGKTPRAALSTNGIHVLEIEGLITEALDALQQGRSLQPLQRKKPTGCGTEQGCAGPGTGCG
jgi:nitrogen fixation protein NifB